MRADPARVTVTTCATFSTATRVKHHDFPEVRVEGPSPSAAASHLTNQLIRVRDSASTAWRRESVQ